MASVRKAARGKAKAKAKGRAAKATTKGKARKSSDDPFADLDLAGLSRPMTDLINALLLYKSMFVGPWFTALGREENAETRGVYDTITKETLEQAKGAIGLIRKWGETPGKQAAEEVTEQVLTRLLRDMLELKKNSTEVFLGAGIRSPSEDLRKEFLALADVDRRHAGALRDLLGIRIPQHDKKGHATPPRAGPQIGPFAAGTFMGTIRNAIEDSRAHGYEPARLVVSSEGLRHLRDEGAVEPRQGDVFGVPVDVDFSWAGEAFALTSTSRLSLAEIVTEMYGGKGSSGRTGSSTERD